MSLKLQPLRLRRAMSLTPMIDVVFLLLVFFMLAARFDQTTVMPIALTGAGGAYSGPPRLIDVTPDTVLINGVAADETILAASVLALMEAPDDLVILRTRENADVQRLVDVMELLRNQGVISLTLIE